MDIDIEHLQSWVGRRKGEQGVTPWARSPDGQLAMEAGPTPG